MNELSTPSSKSFDVVIVGGAVIGSSVACFLGSNPDFNGSILVVEKDPTYEFTSTAACASSSQPRSISEFHSSRLTTSKICVTT